MSEHVHAIMDRSIFNLNLSVEATSAYIVVTALVGDNLRPSLDAIQGRWTKSNPELDEALRELIGRNVLRAVNSPDGQPLYYPNPATIWN